MFMKLKSKIDAANTALVILLSLTLLFALTAYECFALYAFFACANLMTLYISVVIIAVFVLIGYIGIRRIKKLCSEDAATSFLLKAIQFLAAISLIASIITLVMLYVDPSLAIYYVFLSCFVVENACEITESLIRQKYDTVLAVHSLSAGDSKAISRSVLNIFAYRLQRDSKTQRIGTDVLEANSSSLFELAGSFAAEVGLSKEIEKACLPINKIKDSSKALKNIEKELSKDSRFNPVYAELCNILQVPENKKQRKSMVVFPS